MAYSENVLNAARRRLEQARAEQEAQYRDRREQVYDRYPRVKEIDRELRGTTAEIMAAAFRKGEDPQKALAAAKEKNRQLQEERAWILETSEYGEDYLDETPVCPRCGGTGYIGAEMCECLQELCRQEQKKELSVLIGNGREKFSAFRLDYYSDQVLPGLGFSARSVMEENLDDCREYARRFSGHSPNLLFTGKPGLGKTFLSGCIARAVLEKGFSVVYETVGRILSDFESVRFGDNSEESRRSLDRYNHCDLLIIDDLGTELLNQFSMSSIYTLLNDRILAEKPMIVSTNLTTTEIQSRYNPQIASRLLGTFDILSFYGEDIRLRGRI